MAAFLSEEWLEALAGLTGSLPGVSGAGSVDLAVLVAPRTEVHVHWLYSDGAPGGGGVGPLDSPDLSLTVASADAADLLRGGIDPSVAFMRGRLKASGDQKLLLAFLRSTSGDRWESWREKVAAIGLADP